MSAVSAALRCNHRGRLTAKRMELLSSSQLHGGNSLPLMRSASGYHQPIPSMSILVQFPCRQQRLTSFTDDTRGFSSWPGQQISAEHQALRAGHCQRQAERAEGGRWQGSVPSPPSDQVCQVITAFPTAPRDAEACVMSSEIPKPPKVCLLGPHTPRSADSGAGLWAFHSHY